MNAFFKRHAATTMFMRSNLAAHGTQETEHRYGTRYFLAEDAEEISAIGAITNGGYLMCQSEGAPPGFYQRFAQHLRGQTLRGMTGAPNDVRAVFDALGCHDAEFALRNEEPLYEMGLAELDFAQTADLSLQNPKAVHADLLAQWFAGYRHDTGSETSDGPTPDEAARIFIESPDGRMLMASGEPVAMTNFNARGDATVQIGGVYVPDPKRGHGYGGAVVALHLMEARAAGVQNAILFAATPHAARAYEAIGFRRTGSYEVALFAEPWEVPQ